MEDEREPCLMAVAGEKGVGKSFTTQKEIERYIQVQKRPVVIFDVNMEVIYKQYKTIMPFDVPKLEGAEIRRVVPITKKGVPMDIKQKTKLLIYLLKSCKNKLLLIEDINNYVVSTRIQAILGLITTNRHRGQDIILHVQSLAKLDPTLYENTNIFRLHHQKDNVARYKDKIPNIEVFTIAKNLVDNEYNKGNIRFYAYLTDKHKIIGNFNKEQFNEACLLYLRKNKSEIADLKAELDNENATKEEVIALYLKKCERYYGNLK